MSPSDTYVLRGPDMSITIPSGELYVTALSYPDERGMVRVSFTMAVSVHQKYLFER